jgi:hypothetical protein
VSVRDTGIGLAPEDQARIFDLFQQGNQSSNPFLTRPEGTGLGLTLARRFVELHGGRLSVESAVGAGSTFSFTLPSAGGHPRHQAHIVGTGPTILVIEDDLQAVELLHVFLREAGFSDVTTADGAEALGAVKEQLPELRVYVQASRRGRSV